MTGRPSRHRRLGAIIAASSAVLLGACSSGTAADPKNAGQDGSAAKPADDAGATDESVGSEVDAALGDDGAPTYAPTFTAIYDEVLSQSCALVFCHASATDFLVIDSKEDGYAHLVNTPAMGPKCAPTGLMRVNPGNPDMSLLYLKITNPPCGQKMPIIYGTVSGSLDPRAVAQIKEWIAAGAKND